MVADLLALGSPALLPADASFRTHGWLKQQRNALRRIVRDSLPAAFEDFKVDLKPSYPDAEWVVSVGATKHWTSVGGLTSEGATLVQATEAWLRVWPGAVRTWEETVVPIPQSFIPEDELTFLWSLSSEFLAQFSSPAKYWDYRDKFYTPCVPNHILLTAELRVPLMEKAFNPHAGILAQKLKHYSGGIRGDSE